MFRLRSLLLVLAFAGTACGKPSPTEPITVDEFIEVMVELRVAARETRGTNGFQTRREAILSRHGVTDSALVEWVRRYARDVAAMSAVWDTIDARLAVPEETR